ncbi:uncharacterized protein LOC127859481 isoform X5 [Dreissena polymorpha]|uniref:uncharacterized protein LOC127859481 isoform X5 n=1 Tax=Dreissena polymorpha TaxID=45954 RepID=UPI002264CA87|nr:uncharacterized protein LOC127859481 isoform X5 [Dreissena polymorpha]
MELIFKWLLVVLAIKQVCTASAPTPPDNKGTEFILMFMENVATADKQFDLELYCTTQQTTPVTVHVTTPLWNNPRVDETFTVIDGNVTKIIISASLRMTGSGVDTKGIHVSADAEVACYGANKETTSNDVYLGLPVDALGMDYYTVSHSPPENMAEIGIAGTEDGTTVSITLPAGHGPLSVTFQGKTYHEGETISVTLDRFKTLQLQSKGDLTGTHIVTSKPVAVFSGNIKTNVGTGTFSDHLVEQMVPADRWGKEFVTAPIPGRTVGDVFRVVAKANGTVVSITGRPPITLNAGESREFEIPSDQYAHITSTEPVMIAQFVKSQLTSAEPADPSMILVPPLEQFGSDYTFTTPEYSRPDYGNASIYRYQNEFMIVAKKSDIGGLLLDGKPFPQSTWKDIPGTNLVGTYLTLPHGPHTVRHSDPLSTFGGYLYGHAYRESYGFPTGMRTALIYSSNCKPTPTVPGDGIDNDCDNKIDEELCTPDNNMNDDDGDGRQDEDCVKTTPIDGFWGTWAAWSTSCSVTCGDGVVTRKRKCDAPVPKFGGKNCTGLDFENKACYSGQLCSLDAANFCASNAKGIAPNPLNCAQYIDCSRNGPYNQTHLFECPYPDLFNANTLQCDNFENVHCDKRMEPMDPCDYLQNQCNGSDPNCKPCRDRWPSCVAKDDGRQAVSVFAPEYADCKKNRTMSQGKCDIGFFDSRSHQCVPHNPGSLQFYCRVHPTAKIPEPHNCAKYYDCTKKGRTLQDFTSECQYPDLFSMTTNQCENFSQVACTPRTEPQAPCEYDQNHCPPTNTTCSCPDNHADCRGQLDGTQSWPGKLWGPDFVDCLTNRTMKQQRCSPGLYFNPVLKKCIDSVKPGEVTDVCSANPTLVLQDSQNCAKYINCSLATSLLGNHMQECTYPDLFSMTTKSCDKFEKVNCDQRPEPMAPCDYDQNKCAPGNATCHCPDNLPSCVGLADGNQSYPSRIWKPDYVVCYKNRTILPTHKCTKGYFHPVLKQCTENIAKTDAVPYCKANPTGIIPVPDSCAQYINCSRVASGLANADPVSECIYPDLFSMASMSCQDFTTVQCDKRPEPMAPCEYKQFNCSLLDPKCVPCPDRLPSCVGLVDGNQSYPSRMWKPDYVDCYKNRTTLPVKRCTKGYFHPVLKQCTEIVNKTDAKPYCTANPNDVIAMPDDCAQYIDCTVIIGNPTAEPVKECPYPDLFSTLSMVCQDFTTVQCDKRPEPMAPCEYEKLRCAPGNSTCNCPATLPSCVGLTNGNQPFPSRMWKPDFVICNKNRTNLPTEKCTKGYFHPTLKRCTEDITKPDATPYCQANPTAIVPLSDNCAQYINCSVVAMGTIADPVQECTYPDLFSKVTLMCVNFTTLPSCDGRREPMAPCEYKQNLCSPLQTPGCTPCPSRLPSCVGVPDGDQPFPGQLWADNFVHCYRNRTLGVDKCPAGSVFDPNTRQCTSSINSKNIDSFCQANPTAVKTNPSNCAQFFNCSDLSSRYGHFLEECTYPMLFSNTTLTCERFESVNCKNRSEPQAPCEYLQNLCNPSDPNCVRCPDRLPSCVGLADGNQPFPNRMWKPDYVVCNKNRTNLPTQKCTKGYFHPVLKQCTEDVNKTDAKDYCHANPTSVLPMANNCAKYINCSAFLVGDVPDPVVECMYPDLFSTATLRCEKFESVVCNKRKEPQAPCQYERNLCPKSDLQCLPCPERLPSCVGRHDGPQPDTTHLWGNKYIECFMNRTMTTRTCHPGEYFHPRLRQCRSYVDPVDIPEYCKMHATEVVTSPDNCAVYYNCSDSRSAFKAECPYPDLFDSTAMRCSSFEQIQCGNRPEPMAPCQYDQNQCKPSDLACKPCVDRFPSCVGHADGNWPVTSSSWGPDYVKCYKNRTLGVEHCKTGFFHPVQRTCTSDIGKNDLSYYCDAHPSAVIGNPDNCAQYVNCSLVTATTIPMQECTYPDLFAADTRTCSRFTTVTCGTRMEPQAPCEYDQNKCAPGDSSCTPCPERLPSCIGIQDGAQPFTGREWTQQYMECFRNRTVALNTCPPGSVFEPYQSSCVSRIDKNVIQSYCQFNPGALKEHADNCAQYYDCSQPASPLGPFLMECPYPQLFSALSSACVPYQQAQCGRKTEPKAPCDYIKNLCSPTDPNCIPCSSRLPSCDGLSNGPQPYPGRLWQTDYVSCRDNRTIAMETCPRGFFSPLQRSCVDSVTKTTIVDYCKAHPEDIMTDPSNCARFFNCSDPASPLGPYQEECSYPGLFSVQLKSCMPFDTVDCLNRHEPKAPCDYASNQCSPQDSQCVPCAQRHPSCEGLPDGDNLLQSSLWKGQYIRCMGNRTLSTERCGQGYFNPHTRFCQTDVDPVDIVPYCKANPQAIVAKGDNCAQYFLCSKVVGTMATVEECPYPDLFSRSTLRCERFESVDCDRRPEPQAPCQYSQNQCAPNDPTCAPCASRLPSCVREQDGFHPVGGQAWGSGYVECRKNRTISVSQCPQGSYFSPTDHRCTQNINTGDIDSFCRAHPTHIRLHPTNCAQYYDCAATALGGQILRECPYPQLFDPATLTCKPFTNVSCGIRFEPTAPCEYMSNQCSPSQTGCVPCNQRQPSCNGLADGYHAFPGLLWQQQYIICYKNRTTSVTQCTGVQLFNPTSRKCVDVKDLTKAEIQSYCQSHPTSVLADPTDCSRYFQCSAIGLSSGGHLQCTYPDLFSPTSGRCVDFSLVDCGTRKEPTRPCEYDHNQCPTSDPACVPCPTRLPDCQGRPDGDNGIPGMLWSLNYVRCQGNRTVEVKRCTQGVFDPNIRACSSNIGPSHINDLCFSNPKAIVPHPTNCAQYFDCSKASTPFGHFLMECPYPDLFDERTLTCKPFTQVQCGNKAEPKAPCEYFQNLCPAGNLTCTPCGQRLPSCVGLPDGSRSLPSQSWSPQFMTCSLGRTLALHQCPSGVFDPTRMVCSTSVQPVDIPKYCQANPQAVLPDPSSCSKYFNCSKPETGYQQECLYPMLFSVEFSSCDTFRNVQCGTRPEPQTPCEYTQNQCSLGDLSCVPCPQRLPSCRGLPDGINGAPGHLWTDMYIQCLQNRTMVVQHCRHGFFNPLQKQCVENVDPNQVNQVCQANPSAIFSDPTNCAKYYDCRQTLGFGSSYLKECSYPDLFSVSLKSCQNFTTVDCENRTEPQAPCEYDQNQCASMFNCRPCSERLASCVGLPDGENAYPGRRWTADHVYCLGNRTLTSGRCSSPSIFDPIARKCTPNVDPSHAPDYCQTNPQAMFPSTRSAAQYFDCSQPQSPLGTPYLQECTYPDLFHASNLRCQGFTSVPTDQRPTPQAPCEYEKNHCQTWDVGCVPCPQRLHSCVGLPDGLNPIEGKQWSPEYVNCHLNRTVGSGRCSQGVFDPNSRQCASTTQPGPLSIPDQCRQNPSLLIPDSRSCALYYNCSKIVGTLSPLLPAQLEECDYPKLYSTQYGRCLDFQSVQCNDRNEVMAPCQYLQNQCNSADATCQSCMERLPSCIGLPDGNNPIPGRYWTREYIHCYKNRTLAKESCQTGFFNPDTRQCSDDVSKGNIDDYCKNHPNAKVANADNCAQFYECTKTLPRIAAPVTDGLSLVIRQECHYPDLFSTITQRCEPFTKVNCDKRPEPQAPCEYTQNQCAPGDATCEPCQDRLPSCVGLGEGDRGVPGREYTSLYVSCHLNRTLDVKHCQQGFFDAGLHMCVTQINSANIGPYCQRNPQAILPHPTNCAWYYNCSVKGLTRQSVYPYDIEYAQECPYPDLFSAATMRCEHFHSVSCRGNFEPQAPCEYLKNRCDPSQPSCLPCPNRLPSCKSLPDGQQVISNLYNLKQYLVDCDTSRTMSYQECTPGSLVCSGMPTMTTTPPFIATTPRPTTPIPTQPLGICDINRGRVVGNPTHCGQYYNCTRLFPPFVFECQYPQMFSEVTHQCEDFQRVSCGARPEFKAPCDYDQNQCQINSGPCVPCNQRLPSCVNLPDGNHAFPGREGTSSYITCLKGRTMSMGQCPYGVFDQYREICSTPTTASTTVAMTTSSNTIAGYCVQHPRNVIPDPSNCHRYYDCSTYNTPLGSYLMECPFPQVFDATWTICRYRTDVNCGQRPVPTSQCDYKLFQCIGMDCERCTGPGVQTLPPTTRLPVTHTTHPPVIHTTHETGPNCVGKPDGLNAYPGRELTGYYIVCQQNRLIETGICIIDKILDPILRRCSYPSEKDVIGPYCRANPDVLIPSDINCAQYYRCGSFTNGYQNVLMECASPLLFSTIDNICKHYTLVQCGQRFQPPRP